MDGMDPTQFLFSGNQVYVAELYERYLDDPHSVDHKWQDFFSSLADDARDLMGENRGASWAPSSAGVLNQGELETLSEQMAGGHVVQSGGNSRRWLHQTVGKFVTRRWIVSVP